jgi:two-component system sensor histidine kinase/response regulator
LLHALRGGVGSVGAKRFASTCLTLEQAIREQGDAHDLFDQAGRDLDEALVQARAWLERFELPAG